MEQVSHSPLKIVMIMIIAAIHASCTVLLAVASPSRGNARNRLDNVENRGQVVRLEMTHVDSRMDPIDFHSPERLRRAVQKSIDRAEGFASQAAKATYSQSFGGLLAVDDSSAPVYAAPAQAGGQYLVNLSIGTPPQSFSGIFDTGSDLVWRQSVPCIRCYQQRDPDLFNSSKSSTYKALPCTSAACSLAFPSPLCAYSLCMYNYTYGDGSTSKGILSSDTLTIGGSKVDSFVFGAGFFNNGSISELMTDGFLGMGGGPLSLVSQMSSTIEGKFSYCLVSWDDAPSQTSPLLLGPSAVLTGALVVSTPIITRPNMPTFYYLGLKGISFNGTLLTIPPGTFDLQADGRGGVIFDSGTTVTILVDEAYTPLKNAYSAAIHLPQVNGSLVGLDLCFDNSANAELDIPLITFHFDGADVELPAENIFIDIQGFGLCLAFKSLPFNINIYGNIQQQNFQILFDKGPANQLSFKPTTCGTI